MTGKEASRWLSWVAVLAAAAFVPACTMNGGGGGNGSGGPLWANLTSGGGAAGPAGLVWRDPNLGPISGGGGLGGDMTFETAGEIDITNGTATTNPFKGDLNPVSVALPQNDAEEQNLEGFVSAYYQSFTVQQSLGGLGGGGGGGLGFGGGINLTPPVNPEPKIRLEARADCENCAIQNTPTPSEDGVAPNSLMWRLIKCGVNPNLTNPSFDHGAGGGAPLMLMAPDAQAAFNAMGGTLTSRLTGTQGSGYFGAGYWTLNNQYWYSVAVIDLPLGQVP